MQSQSAKLGFPLVGIPQQRIKRSQKQGQCRGGLLVTKRQVEDYLQDILDAVATIEQFTADTEFEAFSRNLEKVFAVSSAIALQPVIPTNRAISLAAKPLA